MRYSFEKSWKIFAGPGKTVAQMQNTAGKTAVRCPGWTLVMMALALASLLVLVDWTGTGVAKPLWMFAFPLAFGAAGGIVAAVKKAHGWAAVSAGFRIILLPIMTTAITLFQGP